MSLVNYLTKEEDKAISDLKEALLHARSIKEVDHFVSEINYLLDLAEKRYSKDQGKGSNRSISTRNIKAGDFGSIQIKLPQSHADIYMI